MFGLGKKNPEQRNGISGYAQRLMDMLDCPCKHFPKGSNVEVIMSAYNEAFARREMDGCTPLLIVPNDMLLYTIDEFAEIKVELLANRDKLLASEPIDAHKWFVNRLNEHKNDFGEHWKEVVGTIENNPNDVMNRFSGIVNFGSNKSVECILAKIPTANPWEVFAWLPFGGWNEIPAPEEILWIAKYWYEKYGAIPAVRTCDILEFSAAPVKDEKAAMDLALEHFAFCFDRVAQGVDTIGRLAGSLMQSSTWYFWWD